MNPPGRHTRVASSRNGPRWAMCSQHEARDHSIEGIVFHGPGPGEIVADEVDRVAAEPLARALQHPRGEVHGRDVRAGRRQPRRVPPRAAPCVEDASTCHLSREWRDHEVVEGYQRIAFVIIDRGPAIVSVLRGHVLDLDGGAGMSPAADPVPFGQKARWSQPWAGLGRSRPKSSDPPGTSLMRDIRLVGIVTRFGAEAQALAFSPDSGCWCDFVT